ncbi:hypothetical protein [Gordonia paraffinivorans]|nr:hypothetical protein [Gordonia paraffinivorans]VFA89914.1 Uncharacterised protein [Gordonia paraffinivorans]
MRIRFRSALAMIVGLLATAATIVAVESPASAGRDSVLAYPPQVRGHNVTVTFANTTPNPKLCTIEALPVPRQPRQGDPTFDQNPDDSFEAGVGRTTRNLVLDRGRYNIYWVCTGYESLDDEYLGRGWTVWGTRPPVPISSYGQSFKRQYTSDPLPVTVTAPNCFLGGIC